MYLGYWCRLKLAKVEWIVHHKTQWYISGIGNSRDQFHKGRHCKVDKGEPNEDDSGSFRQFIAIFFEMRGKVAPLYGIVSCCEWITA